MLKQIRGQTIVFCAFIPDRTILSDIIKSELKEDIAYLGDYQNYQNRSKRILLINQASCAGLNLQFSTKGDNNSIFYNNTRRSIHRWQAEDRNWRTGVVGETNIWDIICNNSVDNSIFKRLKENKDFSDLVLDDIRKIIAGTYETEYERAE
jgi:SNF2 family DNA or RNA helicase